MGDEIGHESWATRSVMGNDKIERATRLVMGNDERVTRSRRDRSWVTMALMRSVLGGLVFGGDAISMGCDLSGGAI